MRRIRIKSIYIYIYTIVQNDASSAKVVVIIGRWWWWWGGGNVRVTGGPGPLMMMMVCAFQSCRRAESTLAEMKGALLFLFIFLISFAITVPTTLQFLKWFLCCNKQHLTGAPRRSHSRWLDRLENNDFTLACFQICDSGICQMFLSLPTPRVAKQGPIRAWIP